MPWLSQRCRCRSNTFAAFFLVGSPKEANESHRQAMEELPARKVKARDLLTGFVSEADVVEKTCGSSGMKPGAYGICLHQASPHRKVLGAHARRSGRQHCSDFADSHEGITCRFRAALQSSHFTPPSHLCPMAHRFPTRSDQSGGATISASSTRAADVDTSDVFQHAVVLCFVHCSRACTAPVPQ